MARQITLNGIQRGGITIFKHGGQVRVEASYAVLSGTEVVKTVTRDITEALDASQKVAIANAYDAVFNRVEGFELT